LAEAVNGKGHLLELGVTEQLKSDSTAHSSHPRIIFPFYRGYINNAPIDTNHHIAVLYVTCNFIERPAGFSFLWCLSSETHYREAIKLDGHVFYLLQ